MLIDVINAVYLSEYKIRVTFEDGKTGVVDLGKNLKKIGVFKELENMEYFRRFYINKDLGAICWPNGQDIAPETIYELVAA